MAVFPITPATSVLTTLLADHALDSDTAGADTLIVNPEAFLIALGLGAHGALLANTGDWTVTVNGSVFSEEANGILLASGNAAASKIAVGADGEVGGVTGILVGSAVTIANSGVIAGTDNGIGIENAGTRIIGNSGIVGGDDFSILDVNGLSADQVTNSGILRGVVNLSGGDNRLTNSGTIENDIVVGGGNDTIANSKTILGIVTLGNGANTLSNNGAIDGDVVGGGGSDTVSNSGTLGDSVLFSDGDNKLTNSGTIVDDVIGGSGNDTVVNSKMVGDDVSLGNGANTISNKGTIGGDVLGGSGVDTVTSTGKIFGIVDLGNGDDIFSGGNNAETVVDDNGADSTKLGGGNDTYTATGNSGTDGIDAIDAGTGIDTYDASAALGGVVINLDNVVHGIVVANAAGGAEVAGALKDTITGFENAKGGAGGDFIYGTAAVNILDGGNGDDELFGFAGNDTLNGGADKDLLVGGAGKDTLTGGGAADTFAWTAITDSSVGKSNRDAVTDFQDGSDKIDVSAIDANSTNAVTTDAFTFIGANVAFSNVAGQLRAYWTATGQIVQGDVDGDAKADFSIEVIDPNHIITFSNADFLL